MTQLELARVLETRVPAEQIAVLRRLGIVPLIGAKGTVQVLREVIREAMLGRQQQDTDQPDWGAYNAAKSGSGRRLAS